MNNRITPIRDALTHAVTDFLVNHEPKCSKCEERRRKLLAWLAKHQPPNKDHRSRSRRLRG